MNRRIELVNQCQDEANFIAGAAELVEELCSPDTHSANAIPAESISRVMGRMIKSAEKVHELVDELHQLTTDQQKPAVGQSKEAEQ